MRSVAIPRARTKYLTLTIGETRSLAALAPPTNLTSRLENIAASCYLHSPIEAATARGMRVIVSRSLDLLPASLHTVCLAAEFPSLFVADLRPSVLNWPPLLVRAPVVEPLLSGFGALLALRSPPRDSDGHCFLEAVPRSTSRWDLARFVCLEKFLVVGLGDFYGSLKDFISYVGLRRVE